MRVDGVSGWGTGRVLALNAAGGAVVGAAALDALLAPAVAVAQQLEALAAQRVEGVRDAKPPRTVGTKGS